MCNQSVLSYFGCKYEANENRKVSISGSKFSGGVYEGYALFREDLQQEERKILSLCHLYQRSKEDVFCCLHFAIWSLPIRSLFS